MLPKWMSIMASIGMAVVPPLVYADQAISIVRKRDSAGFSRDVCAILLIANITRCFFWLSVRFDVALLLQSIFMIFTQLGLLYICIAHRKTISRESLGSSRPFAFWHWPTYAQYIEFLAGMIMVEAILYLIFSRWKVFVSIMGFAALGLESTLPIPQMISNYKQRSLYGFRLSTLVGWVFGDCFKVVYFFVLHSHLQFKVCAIFQLSVDFVIVGQRLYYGNALPHSMLSSTEDDDLEQALSLVEE